MYIRYPAPGGAGGILSINGDTTEDQLIVGGTGISAATVGGTTTITNSAPFVALNSFVWVNTGNGYGAVGTKIRRYSNTRASNGSDITYADSANNGASFTINTSGIYVLDRQDRSEAGLSIFGFSVNSSSLSTVIYSLPIAEILKFVESESGVWAAGGLVWVGYLTAGTVIRPQDQGGASMNTDAYSYMKVTRLA